MYLKENNKMIIGVCIGIGTSVLGSIIYAWVDGKPLILYMDHILNYKIKVWHTLLISGIVIYTIWRFYKVKKEHNSHLDYTSDTINNIKWTWEWYNDNNCWDIRNIYPVCENDNTTLNIGRKIENSGNLEFEHECPICYTKIKYSNTDYEMVLMSISDNIKKKIY